LRLKLAVSGDLPDRRHWDCTEHGPADFRSCCGMTDAPIAPNLDLSYFVPPWVQLAPEFNRIIQRVVQP
jgi:hypothetical protein